MLHQNTIKTLQSLDKKKFRQKYNLFLVEGNKTIKELNKSIFKIKEIYSLDPDSLDLPNMLNVFRINEKELKEISFLKHPKDSVAVCHLPKEQFICKREGINLVLDGIQDPGNMGTIIRLADWFGIEQIICSEDTVDLYNPKVIQASMGSFVRTNIFYTNIEKFLNDKEIPNYVADMQGENMYKVNFPEKFNLILGNEGNGIRQATRNIVDNTITIPRFGSNKTTESLNVAMAASIILGHIFSKK